MKPTSIRLKEEIVEVLKREAEKQKRSFSKQIEIILEKWVNSKKRTQK